MECRSCNVRALVSILPLGKMPLANRLLQADQLTNAEPTYNLEIMLCENCGLVQLKDIVPPEVLFSDYLYFSSNSNTMIQSMKDLVNRIIPQLPKNAKIVEIASNDGYLLQHYLEKNMDVLGIEPAVNIAKIANEKGIPTKAVFFNQKIADELKQEGIEADIIHANNVMAHVPDINDFVKALSIILKKEGTVIIEIPYLLDLINKCEFDTIYHEHVFYFSLTALMPLFERNNLTIIDVEHIAIHGGSLRLFIKHSKPHQKSSTNIINLLTQEQTLNIKSAQYYQNFLQRILEIKENLKNLLIELKNQNKKLAAYGASAKGSTLLNYFGIGQDLLDLVVDRSPAKQGLFTSGTRLPIYAPEKLIDENIDYAVLLTWNFIDEIMQQQSNFLKKGGKFIVPIPNVRIVQ